MVYQDREFGILLNQPEAFDAIDASYGWCDGCGGQEPKEVLEQMNGYCSSQCEKENS